VIPFKKKTRDRDDTGRRGGRSRRGPATKRGKEADAAKEISWQEHFCKRGRKKNSPGRAVRKVSKRSRKQRGRKRREYPEKKRQKRDEDEMQMGRKEVRKDGRHTYDGHVRKRDSETQAKDDRTSPMSFAHLSREHTENKTYTKLSSGRPKRRHCRERSPLKSNDLQTGVCEPKFLKREGSAKRENTAQHESLLKKEALKGEAYCSRSRPAISRRKSSLESVPPQKKESKEPR